LPKLRAEGIDETLIREAFDKRFEEVRLTKIRRYLPGILPEEMRPEYTDPDWDKREDPVPVWVTVVHLLFMAWTIINAHYAPLFVLGLLFFLGFAQVSAPYQNKINLQPAMLVGFFLAGLVIHGGLQGWWIEPVLGGLGKAPLLLGATILTSFNDNAAITYLSTLVPHFTDSLKYAVVAGAVTGGGLTVIANAPNPAGQSILKKHFDDAVSPIGLLQAALVPTIILFFCFLLLG
jgi:Na+/H+ antiporter NhaD/arsenite permease-like protein